MEDVRQFIEVEICQADYVEIARKKLPKSHAAAKVASMRTLPRVGDSAQHSASRVVVTFEVPLGKESR